MKHTLLLLNAFLLSLVGGFAQTDTLRFKTMQSTDSLIVRYYQDNGMLYNSKLHLIYNKNDRLVKEFKTDSLGRILPRVGLSAIIIYEYEERGDTLIEQQIHYDAAMQPTINDRYHYHRVQTTYAPNGQKLEDWSFYKSGRTQTRVGFTYDERANLSEVRYLEEDGQLDTSGYAMVRMRYDSLNRETERYYLRANEQPYSDQRIPYYTETSYLGDIACPRYFSPSMEPILQLNQLQVCDAAPPLSLPDSSGQMRELYDLLNEKPLVLHFWMPSSIIDAREMPELVTLYDQNTPPDFDIISIAISRSTSDEQWKHKVQELEMSWPIHLSALREEHMSLKVNYPITNSPRFIVLNKDGLIVGANIRRVIDLIEVLNKLKR